AIAVVRIPLAPVAAQVTHVHAVRHPPDILPLRSGGFVGGLGVVKDGNRPQQKHSGYDSGDRALHPRHFTLPMCSDVVVEVATTLMTAQAGSLGADKSITHTGSLPEMMRSAGPAGRLRSPARVPSGIGTASSR